MSGNNVGKASEEAYRHWLSSETGLQGRSLSDVVSRTRRVLSMADLSHVKTNEEVEIALLSSAEFKTQEMSIKSQIRRAAKLYVNFVNGSNA